MKHRRTGSWRVKIVTISLFLWKFSCTQIKIGLQLKSVSANNSYKPAALQISQALSLSLSFNSNSYIYLFWFTEVCKQLAPLNTRHWGTRYILRTHVLDFRNKLNIIKQAKKFDMKLREVVQTCQYSWYLLSKLWTIYHILFNFLVPHI